MKSDPFRRCCRFQFYYSPKRKEMNIKIQELQKTNRFLVNKMSFSIYFGPQKVKTLKREESNDQSGIYCYFKPLNQFGLTFEIPKIPLKKLTNSKKSLKRGFEPIASFTYIFLLTIKLNHKIYY